MISERHHLDRISRLFSFLLLPLEGRFEGSFPVNVIVHVIQEGAGQRKAGRFWERR